MCVCIYILYEILELIYSGCKYGWSLIILFPFQQDLDELPLEAETVERGYSSPETATSLPKIRGLPSSSLYSTGSLGDYYEGSPKNTKSERSSHANMDTNGNGGPYTSGFDPMADAVFEVWNSPARAV